MSDFWDNLMLGVQLAFGGSASTVGVVTTNESSAEFGSGGLGVQLETSSMTSGEATTEGAPLVGNITTAPSAAGGPLAGTTVVGGASGIAGCLSAAGPETSSGEMIGHGNINGNPFMIWEDSSGGINIDCDTFPYSRVEKRAQQTYDALHGEPGKTYRFPAVVMETAEAREAFCKVFGNKPSPEKMRETLAVLERVLMTYERNS